MTLVDFSSPKNTSFVVKYFEKMLFTVTSQELKDLMMESSEQKEQLEVTIRRVGVEDHINIIKLFQVNILLKL
jgi:hypothetical protein